LKALSEKEPPQNPPLNFGSSQRFIAKVRLFPIATKPLVRSAYLPQRLMIMWSR